MFDNIRNINNGRKVSELGNEIKGIGIKCERVTDIIPSKYRSIETSAIIREELNSIGNELESLGEIIVSVSKELENNSFDKNSGCSW